MPVSDVLKNFRNESYGKKDGGKPKEDSGSPRIIKLTDDEAKELQGYQGEPGGEQTCEVTGRLGDNGEFSVTSVHLPGGGMGDEKEMAAEVMGKMPMTMPSPS